MVSRGAPGHRRWLKRHGYFDRAPELELLRHLRNGVAHGNLFRIDNPTEITKFPAHNRLAWVKSDSKAIFEITPSLRNQPVLFDFMGPGDILEPDRIRRVVEKICRLGTEDALWINVDLLMSVGLYLIRMGNGDPLCP